MSDMYVPEYLTTWQAITHVINNRANVVLGRLDLAKQCATTNNMRQQIALAKEACELLVAQVAELRRKYES